MMSELRTRTIKKSTQGGLVFYIPGGVNETIK